MSMPDGRRFNIQDSVIKSHGNRHQNVAVSSITDLNQQLKSRRFEACLG